jgi:CheY-like chemotaxis protein
MLLSKLDGDLTPEQERQVSFIRKSADDLSAIVSDLLDLAKVEAGKIEARPADFEVAELFAALKGVSRPLLQGDAVALVFEEAEGLPVLHTDEGKVSQILRNFVSNAIKFTERGEVRVRAERGEGDAVVFSVSDTGIGIAPENQERIFEEFAQVESPVQRRVKGTGLGLPLSRRLAELLGGTVRVESEPGSGSTFLLAIPARFGAGAERRREDDGGRVPVLVVDAEPDAPDAYGALLAGSDFRPVVARSIADARRAIEQERPEAVVLDVLLEGESGWGLLEELKRDEATRGTPVLVVTRVENEQKARDLGADWFALKPVAGEQLVGELTRLAREGLSRAILLVDDDPVARYLLRELIGDVPYAVVEAADGAEGLRVAKAERPAVVFLDLVMPGMLGADVLDALKADPATRPIPVIIYTSETIDDEKRRRLEERVVAILYKEMESRDASAAQVAAALTRAGLKGITKEQPNV